VEDDALLNFCADNFKCVWELYLLYWYWIKF